MMPRAAAGTTAWGTTCTAPTGKHANALGIVSWGIAAVMTMALGTGLSILGLSLTVHYARHRMANRLTVGSRPRPWLVPLVKILGGLALILFAAGLFFTVVPISANGDFIAAGC